jgi:hypothetical protein
LVVLAAVSWPLLGVLEFIFGKSFLSGFLPNPTELTSAPPSFSLPASPGRPVEATQDTRGPDPPTDEVEQFVKRVSERQLSEVSPLATALSAVPNPTERNRCKAIFLWIATNIRYDGSALQQTNPAEVMANRTAVCAGYAELFSELSRALNVECEIVTGQAKSNANDTEEHAWNAVRIDGAWLLVDTTWAAGYYESGPETFVNSLPYFLAPPEEFIYTHFPTHSQLQFLPGKEWTKTDFHTAPWVAPEFFKSGLSFGSHPKGAISEESPLRLWFGLSNSNSGVRLSAEFRASGKSVTGGAPEDILLQNGKTPGKHSWDMEIRVPDSLPSNTFLFIFASESRLNQGLFRPVASYRIF